MSSDRINERIGNRCDTIACPLSNIASVTPVSTWSAASFLT
jgi:hypothetical protein